MKILVQKFGGTSVKDKESRQHALTHVRDAIDEGYKVVVVVSAIGRYPEPYATDSLLELVEYPNQHISKREQDLLLSCGEIISSVVFSNELNQKGINSLAMTGAQAGFVTTDDFTEAKIKSMKVERLITELHNLDVIVVAGFQGQTELGETTTIGRGGSDTSAAALGAALNASYVDIFTDVNGIMTADPRVVSSAKTLDVITYAEICNMAYQGAKVIHPRAVEIAMQADVPIRVRATREKGTGTLVTTSRDETKGNDVPDRLITGIAHMENITQLKIDSEEDMNYLQSHIFKAMAEASISVDFINISPGGVVYTVADLLADKAVSLLNDLNLKPVVKKNCAKVSLVGAGMTGVPGVTAKIVKTLSDANIPILQSADSHTTIWVLIEEQYLMTAMNALHEAFDLNL
ncbi:aspartate kinase [Saliterribacillus persicus]|uniref:Aspartokinase n=1 Tax=Saliterribacillus persicus TaxID=930114 RepID=A0A368XRT2_9BACI|nr:aspartate kinase [Saliterribacillus persicus]RCW70662.1 aspartate kinase [Saliterribacillus persicus]